MTRVLARKVPFRTSGPAREVLNLGQDRQPEAHYSKVTTQNLPLPVPQGPTLEQAHPGVK